MQQSRPLPGKNSRRTSAGQRDDAAETVSVLLQLDSNVQRLIGDKGKGVPRVDDLGR